MSSASSRTRRRIPICSRRSRGGDQLLRAILSLSLLCIHREASFGDAASSTNVFSLPSNHNNHQRPTWLIVSKSSSLRTRCGPSCSQQPVHVGRNAVTREASKGDVPAFLSLVRGGGQEEEEEEDVQGGVEVDDDGVDDDDESDAESDDWEGSDGGGENNGEDYDDEEGMSDMFDSSSSSASSSEEEYDYSGMESASEDQDERSVREGEGGGVAGEASSEVQVYDEIIAPSQLRSIVVTVWVMMYSRKLDANDPKVVRAARMLFIGYMVLMQIFLTYVRIRARIRNDRTPITIENKMANMVKSQLNGAVSGGGNEETVVKTLADRFLTSQSTVREYDMAQANQMRNGLLFSLILNWVLHFKFGQIQPILIESARGFLNLVESPLFQAYVLGRNLERPFKLPSPISDNASSATEVEQAGIDDEESLADEGGGVLEDVAEEGRSEEDDTGEEDDEYDEEEDQSSSDEDGETSEDDSLSDG